MKGCFRFLTSQGRDFCRWVSLDSAIVLEADEHAGSGATHTNTHLDHSARMSRRGLRDRYV